MKVDWLSMTELLRSAERTLSLAPMAVALRSCVLRILHVSSESSTWFSKLTSALAAIY